MNKIDMNLQQERIETAKKRLAKALNLIESANLDIKFACETCEWNEDVYYQIEDGAAKIGYALATLTNWNDAIEQQ